MNDDTSVGVASAVKEGITPSVVDLMMEKDKLSSLDDNTVSEPFPPLSMLVITDGNAPGKSSYANITGIPNGKKVNIRTLFTPGGNGIDVVVLVDSIRAISKRFANTTYGFFLGKKVAYPVVANYVRNTWGKYGLVRSMFSSSTGLFSFQFSSMDGLDAMLENVWVKLYGVPVTALSEDGLSAIATKLGNPLMLDSYTSDMCMQSWGRSSYARVMIELRADVELKDNIVVAMPNITREGHYTCVVEKKTVKKPSQTSRGVPVGPKMAFKPQKEYHPVTKKPNASSSSNMKKGVKPTIEVSNSNPFDVLNSVDNDVEFSTNGGTTNFVNNEATLSGSSFMNIDNDGEFASNTSIGDKIDKIESQICEGKIRLLDNDGYPLVPTGIVKRIVEWKCLLEQWRDSYPDNDDYDSYDDDMYENHDLSEHLQFICDDLDITVRGRKKK
ncbi:cytokinin dehydrogenase 3-like protein [Tanacetum coccineum]